MVNWGQSPFSHLVTKGMSPIDHLLLKRKEGIMYENDIDAIKKAQKGDKEELEKLINDNNRTNMEYSKEI